MEFTLTKTVCQNFTAYDLDFVREAQAFIGSFYPLSQHTCSMHLATPVNFNADQFFQQFLLFSKKAFFFKRKS